MTGERATNAPLASSGFRADIQGLRAVAVLGVLAFHAGVPHLGGGFVGVDVFYVISGFLITGLMLRDVDRGSARTQLVEFYARRVRRILPAAAVVLAATLVGVVLWQNPLQAVSAARDAHSVSVFFANARFAKMSGYFATQPPSVFQQFWSLSLEEQFYALWPLLFLTVVAAMARPKRRSTLALVVAVVSVASFALSVAWVYDGAFLSSAPTRAFFLLPARAWELGIGALLAIFVGQLTRIGAAARAALFIGGLAAVAVAMVKFTGTTHFPAWAALLPTLGTAAVIAAGAAAPVKRVGVVLTNAPAQLVGRYSYSLYLWHWPVLLLVVPHLHPSGWLARAAWMTAISAVAAVATYHLVENPVRRAPALRGQPWRSLAVGALIVVVCLTSAGAVQLRAHDTLTGNPAVATAPAGMLSPVYAVPGNLQPALEAAAGQLRTDKGCGLHCTVTRPGGPTIELLGDSHAGHLGPAVESAARVLGASLRETVLPGCPWFAASGTSLVLPACNTFRRAQLARLNAHPPDVLILSTRDDVEFGLHPAAFAIDVRATLSFFPPGTKVVVVSDTPVGPNVPDCLAAHLNFALPCDRAWPTTLNASLQALVTAAGGTNLDLRPELCDAHRCPTITGNTLMYADGDHFTRAFATSLGVWFATALRPVLAAH